MMCLVRWALALVSPVAVVCFPCFPGCFPESRPWALSLGAVVVRHCLSVISLSARQVLARGAGISRASALDVTETVPLELTTVHESAR